MAKELEIEYKNLLTKLEYQNLLETTNLTKENIHEQTNIYFDTKNGILKEKRQGLRIRLLPLKIEFTLKVPQKNSYTYLEITDILNVFDLDKSLEEQIDLSKSEVLNYLANENIFVTDLKEIGSLTTKRAEKKLDQNTLLVLDESYYYGVTDYELEMEVLDSAIGQKTFENFLAENNIPVRPAKKKIARMFERKQQIAE
ncbi:CYTH domain-containing protein [Vagococcus fluvialis]|uniref:CYTH domain-containing protein n=1 Tax=Vagococcus fluvialis TaxID=2738 RepID=UPI00143329A9|nr:CYTH domain-containing protein [Vagococcus fluvialis]MBO0487654.1 CYTH domain-containing protein [Vagococcus fluvialis]NKC59487.1 CYTH domain-containing protein [Vagococcus fluvialis]NKD50429.1 CYTH domain-containing protein [Vagococcus fluvialis]